MKTPRRTGSCGPRPAGVPPRRAGIDSNAIFLQIFSFFLNVFPLFPLPKRIRTRGCKNDENGGRRAASHAGRGGSRLRAGARRAAGPRARRAGQAGVRSPAGADPRRRQRRGTVQRSPVARRPPQLPCPPAALPALPLLPPDRREPVSGPVYPRRSGRVHQNRNGPGTADHPRRSPARRRQARGHSRGSPVPRRRSRQRAPEIA